MRHTYLSTQSDVLLTTPVSLRIVHHYTHMLEVHRVQFLPTFQPVPLNFYRDNDPLDSDRDRVSVVAPCLNTAVLAAAYFYPLKLGVKVVEESTLGVDGPLTKYVEDVVSDSHNFPLRGDDVVGLKVGDDVN